MKDINSILTKAQNELFPQLEAKIRAELVLKDKEWLIDQIIYLTCERHSLHEQKEQFETNKVLINYIKNKNYDNTKVLKYIKNYKEFTRKNAETMGLLIQAPHMGLASINTQHLSAKGKQILTESKAILYALLYGSTSINVHITREQEEIITITLPKEKSESFQFLKAVTELNCSGTWNDPEGISNDNHANNVELQIEFTDNTKQTISTAIFTALNVINILLINEQILYARTTKVERSSLAIN